MEAFNEFVHEVCGAHLNPNFDDIISEVTLSLIHFNDANHVYLETPAEVLKTKRNFMTPKMII